MALTLRIMGGLEGVDGLEVPAGLPFHRLPSLQLLIRPERVTQAVVVMCRLADLERLGLISLEVRNAPRYGIAPRKLAP